MAGVVEALVQGVVVRVPEELVVVYMMVGVS